MHAQVSAVSHAGVLQPPWPSPRVTIPRVAAADAAALTDLQRYILDRHVSALVAAVAKAEKALLDPAAPAHGIATEHLDIARVIAELTDVPTAPHSTRAGRMSALAADATRNA